MRHLLALCAIASAAAVEPSTDLRLQLGSYPGFRTVSYELAGGVSPDYAIGDRSGGTLEALASYAFAAPGNAGMYLQVGLTARGFTGTDEVGWKHTVDAVGVLIGGGVGWRPAPACMVEIGPTLTLGSARAHEETAGLTADSDRGSYAAIDLRTGVWWNLRKLQIGAVAGVAAESATVRQPAHPGFAGASADATYRGRGGFILLGIGVRL